MVRRRNKTHDKEMVCRGLRDFDAYSTAGEGEGRTTTLYNSRGILAKSKLQCECYPCRGLKPRHICTRRHSRDTREAPVQVL